MHWCAMILVTFFIPSHISHKDTTTRWILPIRGQTGSIPQRCLGNSVSICQSKLCLSRHQCSRCLPRTVRNWVRKHTDTAIYQSSFRLSSSTKQRPQFLNDISYFIIHIHLRFFFKCKPKWCTCFREVTSELNRGTCALKNTVFHDYGLSFE